MTGIYSVAFVVGLPVTILLNDESGWFTFSAVMVSGVCNVYVAWSLRKPARSGGGQGQGALGR